MIKIDLHTHSKASKDGGITPEQYAKLLQDEVLDIIAITDHDRIDYAQDMQKALGTDKIIVGQEVTTTEGDIIGLYLNQPIPVGLTAKEACKLIHKQNGLVCIPHPFETLRKGVSHATLGTIAEHVDMIEGHNGRATFQNYSNEALMWADTQQKPAVASSDAHGLKGVGRTYTVLTKHPTSPTNLLTELSHATLIYKRSPLLTLLYPTINRMKKRLARQA